MDVNPVLVIVIFAVLGVLLLMWLMGSLYRRVRPQADYQRSLDVLTAARESGDAEEVLLIGHNPGLEDLAARLLGRELELPTCGFVRIDLPIENWSELRRDLRGTLVEFRAP